MKKFSLRSGVRETAIDTVTIDLATIPKSPIINPNMKPRKSLQEAWQDADKKFREVTHRPLLNSSHKSKDGYLSQWAAKCEVDNSEDGLKKQRTINILSNILDGLEIVGGLVASGASLVFAPADACFGAISFLIDIPRQIKKVYDTMLELFTEVEEFLVRFKILKRIDDKRRLDDELIENASKMLLSFIDVCLLSIDLFEEHRFSTTLKAALLKNDSGLGGALMDFRRLAKSLDSLTGTIAFEHVLMAEEVGRDTNRTVKEVDLGMKTILASNQETKTERINVQRLQNIELRIFPHVELVLWEDVKATTKTQKPLLPDTYTALYEHDEYQKWLNSPAQRAILFLSGGAGTGKSYMLDALRENLEGMLLRNDDARDEPKVFVAFHVFRQRPTKGAATTGSIPFALRSMAAQIARQSSPYAKELDEALREGKKIGDIDLTDQLWQTLNLATFRAPPASTLYLLFDGLEQESGSKIYELCKVLSAQTEQQNDTKLKLRVVLSGDSKVESKVRSYVTKIEMSALNKSLMRGFVTNELSRLEIFQDSDKKSVAQRKKVMEGMDMPDKDSFAEIRQRLERIQNAIQVDASSSQLDEIISDTGGQVQTGQAKKLLERIASDLEPVYISQANQIITWILYSQTSMDFDDLEAVLLLQQDHDTLNTLERKVQLHFNDLFVYTSDRYLSLKPELHFALRESEDLPDEPFDQQKPLVSMDISIQNVDESAVRGFLSELNMMMSTKTFECRVGSHGTGRRIYANKLQGNLSIVRTCLKLLNEGWSKQTASLLWCARENLPIYLKELVEIHEKHPSRFMSEDLKMIGQGLVSFLSDPFHLIHSVDEDFGSGDEWLATSDNVDAIRKWLELTRPELQAHERRWVDSVLAQKEGKLGFMKPMARAIGLKWITNNTEASEYLSERLFSWLDKYIENSTLSVNNSEEAFVGIPNSSKSVDESLQEDHVENTGSSHERVLETADRFTAVPDLAKSSHIDAVLPTEPTQSPEQTLLQVETELTKDPTDTEISVRERIERMVRWLDENGVRYERDGIFYYRVASIYLAEDHNDAAAEYFTRAREYPVTKVGSIIGLGRVKRAIDHKEEACELWQEAIDLLKQGWQRDEPGDSDREMYAELMEDVARSFGELGRTPEAIEMYEQSLEYRDNLSNRWTTMKLLCMADREQYALDLMNLWSKKYLDRTLEECIYQTVDEYMFDDTLEEFIKAIRGLKLRETIVNALQNSVEIASQQPDSSVRSKLLHLYAIAVATGPSSDRWKIAEALWNEALSFVQPENSTDYRYYGILFCAARSAAGCRFNALRARLLAHPHMPTKEQDEIVEQFHEYMAHNISNCEIYCLGRLGHPDCYAHALNVMLGRMADAKVHCSEDMELALDILSDDMPENDSIGIKLLLRVFCFLGRRVDALSTYSLLDRQRRVTKQDEASTVNDDGIANEPSDYLSRRCDGCSKDITSADPDGFWCCQFCPDYDMCTACLARFKIGELKLSYCDPGHEFIHLYHTEYNDEEIEQDMIRVDWDWIALDNGRFERKDGEVIKLSDWVSRLRKEWGLPNEATSDQEPITV